MKLKNPIKNSILSNLPLFAVKIVIFVSGSFVVSFGVVALMAAKLGVASWDVLHIGLANRSFLSIGSWVQIIGITMIIGTSALDRKQPQIGSAINIILIGWFINRILNWDVIPQIDVLWKSISLMICGIGLMGLGSGMYVATALGAGPRDGITLLLSKISGRSIRLVRTGLEFIALFCGWLVGGPISIGTFVSVLLVGPIMQASLYFWRRQIRNFENFMIQEVK